ncbi:PKD domain-containing protein [Pseudoduganella danionis]|nr:PKD domain-containing protein [Pseudoduganella danionis]
MPALMLVALLSGCGGGSGASALPANTAPHVAMLLGGQVRAGAAGADASATVGSDVLLSGAGSTDAEGDALSYNWTIVSKPSTSALVLGASSGAQVTVKPDVGGTYVFNLKVTDSKGASSEQHATLLVDNSAPVSAIVVSVSYTAQPVIKPTQSVSVGAAIVLDASASTDPDGDPVTNSWQILEQPALSKAALVIGGKTARLVVDAVGLYKVRARGTDPKGAYSDTVYVFDASNQAPALVLVGNVTPQALDAGKSSLQASVGYVVSLNGSASSDPAGKALSYAWTLSSKPAASALQLNGTNAPILQFAPDVLGEYVVKLTVSNSTGETSFYSTTVSVNNNRPLASISSNATPVALPSGPSVRYPANTVITLRGGASSDADGDPITYAWSLVEKPAGSGTTLSSASSVNVQLTPDKDGLYGVLLRTTDPSGAYSEQRLNVEVGTYAPVAVVDRSAITTLAGTTVTASAALSYDEDGDKLSYAWALDAYPVGSRAAIASPSGPNLSFTPDMAGTYVASVTVSDGKRSSIAYVTVRVLAAISGTLELPFVPLEARYSRGLDRLVVVASNPNTLKIVDPFTGAIKSVVLPAAVKSLQLSNDGKLAAVLHEGVLSLVDVSSATLLRSSATGGSHTDAFITNSGVAYLIGQTGGQWVRPGVIVLNARTGEKMSELDYANGFFYGTQRGIFAESKNKAFLIAAGLSPSDISYFTVDGKSNAVLSSGDSPYHGDYAMYSPLYLSENQDLVFTAAGNYFQSETLRYAGRLDMTGQLTSLSHSVAMDETLALASTGGSYPDYAVSYPTVYKRYTGALLLPAPDLTLPLIGGVQSYGVGIFHSADGHHVALVQTGSAQQNAQGVKYYLTYR